jgi:small subunit ribosomal protein S8
MVEADFLTRIRNGYQAGLSELIMPHSKFKEAVAKILAKHAFLGEVAVKTVDKQKRLVLRLKYRGRQPAITSLITISKSGQRVYKGREQIPPVKKGYGITLISTSKGIMAGREARQLKLGGEIIGQVW